LFKERSLSNAISVITISVSVGSHYQFISLVFQSFFAMFVQKKDSFGTKDVS